MTIQDRSDINWDDVEIRPASGHYEDGTKFFLSKSGKYHVTLPNRHTVGVRLWDRDATDHSELREALETLSDQEFTQEQIAEYLVDGEILIKNVARWGELAEELKEEI